MNQLKSLKDRLPGGRDRSSSSPGAGGGSSSSGGGGGGGSSNTITGLGLRTKAVRIRYPLSSCRSSLANWGVWICHLCIYSPPLSPPKPHPSSAAPPVPHPLQAQIIPPRDRSRHCEIQRNLRRRRNGGRRYIGLGAGAAVGAINNGRRRRRTTTHNQYHNPHSRHYPPGD